MTTRSMHPLLCLALFAAGCQRVPQADRAAALETVRKNVRALEEEKIDDMMATIHPQSPVFAATRNSVAGLMQEFDMQCALPALEAVSLQNGNLRVRFEQITARKKEGVTEPRTRMTGVHVLRKDGAAWKIYDTEVIDVEVIDPLPEEPEAAGEQPATAAQNP